MIASAPMARKHSRPWRLSAQVLLAMCIVLGVGTFIGYWTAYHAGSAVGIVVGVLTLGAVAKWADGLDDTHRPR